MTSYICHIQKPPKVSIWRMAVKILPAYRRCNPKSTVQKGANDKTNATVRDRGDVSIPGNLVLTFPIVKSGL